MSEIKFLKRHCKKYQDAFVWVSSPCHHAIEVLNLCSGILIQIYFAYNFLLFLFLQLDNFKIELDFFCIAENV